MDTTPRYKCIRCGNRVEKPISDMLPRGWIRLTRQHRNRHGNTDSLVCSVRCALFEMRDWHESKEQWYTATQYGPRCWPMHITG